MDTRFLLKVAIGVSGLITVIVASYLVRFGLTPSHNQAVWGAFGDYFGGILNPIFAVLAFFGVLWSIGLQTKQMGQIAQDKQSDEILQVVKDIDTRISELLRTNISSGSAETTILQMVSESEREGIIFAKDDAYAQFLHIAKQPGTVVEAVVRDIKSQVSAMEEFIKRHPAQQTGSYNPLIEYYSNKTSRLMPMLSDIELTPVSIKKSI
jgi:hypothetical protein